MDALLHMPCNFGKRGKLDKGKKKVSIFKTWF